MDPSWAHYIRGGEIVVIVIVFLTLGLYYRFVSRPTREEVNKAMAEVEKLCLQYRSQCLQTVAERINNLEDKLDAKIENIEDKFDLKLTSLDEKMNLVIDMQIGNRDKLDKLLKHG